MCRMRDLRCKEVINVRDGNRYGFVCDVIVDVCSGFVHYIVVPAETKAFGLFGCGKEYIISWNDIKRISDDIILVDVNTRDCLKDCH